MELDGTPWWHSMNRERWQHLASPVDTSEVGCRETSENESGSRTHGFRRPDGWGQPWALSRCGAALRKRICDFTRVLFRVDRRVATLWYEDLQQGGPQMTTTAERLRLKAPLVLGRRLWHVVAGFGVVISLVLGVYTLWNLTHPATLAAFGEFASPEELNTAENATAFLNFLDVHANQQVKLYVECNPGPALPVACEPDFQTRSIVVRPSGFGEDASNATTVVRFHTSNTDAAVEPEIFGGMNVGGVFRVDRALTADRYTTVYNVRGTQVEAGKAAR
jgi:hypothetical protein